MRDQPRFSAALPFAFGAVALFFASLLGVIRAQVPCAGDEFNDSHFHLTNYIQEGIDVRAVPEDHGHPRRPIDAVRHSAAAAVVVRATPATSPRPTTCRATRRSTTTRSPTPTSRASTASLSPAEQARFDPMITGFNPADMYARRSHPACAADVSRRVLRHRRVHDSQGIRLGQDRRARPPACTNPALDRILDFAAEAGLVVIIHNDIDMPFAKPDAEPVYLTQMKALLKRHPKTTIIWAHIGLGRIVHPVQASGGVGRTHPSQVEIVEPMLTRSRAQPCLLRHLVGRGREVRGGDAGGDRASGDHPQPVSRPLPVRDRHSGADRPGAVLRGLRHVGAGLAAADARGQLKVRKGNYERIFDAARLRVRAWEQANVH